MKKIISVLLFYLFLLLPAYSNPIMDFENDGNTYWNSYMKFTIGDDMYLINDFYSEIFSQDGSEFIENYFEDYDPLTLAIILYGDPSTNDIYGLILVSLDRSDPADPTEYNKDFEEVDSSSLEIFEDLLNSVRDDLHIEMNLKTLGDNTYTVNEYSLIGTGDNSIRLEYVSAIGRRYYPCITAMIIDSRYKSAVDSLVSTIEYKTRIDK